LLDDLFSLHYVCTNPNPGAGVTVVVGNEEEKMEPILLASAWTHGDFK